MFTVSIKPAIEGFVILKSGNQFSYCTSGSLISKTMSFFVF